MFYEVSTEVMEEVESQLGELNGEAFQTTMTDFWTAIQELSKDPKQFCNTGHAGAESGGIRTESRSSIQRIELLPEQPEHTD